MYDLVTEESFRGRGVEGLGPSVGAKPTPVHKGTGPLGFSKVPISKGPVPKGPGALAAGALANEQAPTAKAPVAKAPGKARYPTGHLRRSPKYSSLPLRSFGSLVLRSCGPLGSRATPLRLPVLRKEENWKDRI
jgi:hypothetical protein